MYCCSWRCAWSWRCHFYLRGRPLRPNVRRCVSLRSTLRHVVMLFLVDFNHKRTRISSCFHARRCLAGSIRPLLMALSSTGMAKVPGRRLIFYVLYGVIMFEYLTGGYKPPLRLGCVVTFYMA